MYIYTKLYKKTKLFFLNFFFDFILGNAKDYTNRRHRELSSPCEDTIYPPGARIPLSRSCSSPAATYGKQKSY